MIKKYFFTSKGSILVLSLMFMTVLTTLAAVFLQRVNATGREGQSEVERVQALYLAEAGINKAMQYLANTAYDNTTDGSWRTGTSTSTACTGGVTESLGSGSYIMCVEDDSTKVPNLIKITVTGTVGTVGASGSFSRTLQVKVKYDSYLEAWWRFDDYANTAEKTKALDSSLHNHDATFVGDFAPPSPLSSYWTYYVGNLYDGGGALFFDGGSYLSIPSTNYFSGTTAFTISVWVYLGDYVSSYGTPNGFPILMNDAGNLVGEGFYIGDDGGDNTPHFKNYLEEGWSGVDDASQAIDLNAWHQIAVVVDFTNGHTARTDFYLDGAKSTTTAGKGNAQGTTTTVGFLGPYYIGNDLDLSYFVGYMDDLRYYTRALSDTEISNLYSYNHNGSHADAIAWAKIAVIPNSWREL